VNELELIDKQFLPYIAGLISWIILLVFKKGGKLKRFDGYLWSPFVVSFSVVCLGWIILQYSVFNGGHTGLKDMFTKNIVSFSLLFVVFSQLLWVSLTLQIFVIKYNRNGFLIMAKVFVWLGIVPAILFFLGSNGS
jgi:hypothetical protein